MPESPQQGKRSLDELVDTADPALPKIQRWIAEAYTPCELLPRSERRAETLLAVQVTTHSTLGAIA